MDSKIKDEALQESRFEFRVFGQKLDDAAKRMARLSMPVPEKIWERNSDEIYILSRLNDKSSVKIRDGKIDIKNFVKAINGFELWEPVLKEAFPIKAELLVNEILPALCIKLENSDKENYTYDEFLNLIHSYQEVLPVQVHKQRFAYFVNNTICEVAKVLINGAEISTISSESTKIEDIEKTIADIGLAGMENVNYLQALKRVVGINNKTIKK
ncbi:hypothetical protein EZJ43_07690 [Pedobacter changchengzhani]|uniref:Uncharacterized protein n=1 Tax=Pedobacter changchengzhani TaxID=2529274 RepID=A0A4R5ML45_9SPHI|nr:hypothetical protein [Pedobacter changchengzhani]TDG36391.1 hypothetical protein EZJ43_07690 [Pedobacter changchengzhani]